MPTTPSAIDGDSLAALIQEAKSGRTIPPETFTELLMYDFQDLEARANVQAHTAELEPDAPQLQAFMRRSLAVLGSLDIMPVNS